jgi:phosphoglycerate dehydrogenase-like enzyme
MARHKIAILLHEEFEMWRPPAWFVERLRTEFPETEVLYSAKNRDDADALRDADVMIGWALPPEQLRGAASLRWIYSITAAIDQFLYPELIASEIAISSAGRVHGPVVAEHAMAMLLALAKRLPTAVRYQERRKWAMEAIWKEQPRPREVRGATLVAVGMGSIGAEVASMATALKMNVIGVREHPERAGANETVGYDALNSAITRADYVVLAAPLTSRTRRMIDERRLQLFKPAAFLINVSRGALVDEDALVKALHDGRISGAALDVFEEEPLSRWSPLWKMPQVLITPHTAFLTENVWQRHYEVFAANFRQYQVGQPLEGAVDKKRGY